jgi:5-oxopent-3-ene-1,2,5-tricarboxylate decarboxylase/2-hydroxyhepta-2,4-diene-1,7-dioate isomerase
MVADIARYLTLLPGDIILTGTPAHSRSLDPGDRIELEITDVGRLGLDVVHGSTPRADGIGHPPMDTPEVRRVALGNDERVRPDFRENYRRAARS